MEGAPNRLRLWQLPRGSSRLPTCGSWATFPHMLGGLGARHHIEPQGWGPEVPWPEEGQNAMICSNGYGPRWGWGAWRWVVVDGDSLCVRRVSHQNRSQSYWLYVPWRDTLRPP